MLKEETWQLILFVMPAWDRKRREAKELYRYGEYISAGRGTGCLLLLQLDLV